MLSATASTGTVGRVVGRAILGEDGVWTPGRTENKTCQRADELPVSQQASVSGEEMGAARSLAPKNHQ